MLTIGGDGETDFRVTLPDGTKFTNPDEYAVAFAGIARDAERNGKLVAFRFTERVAEAVDRSVNVSVTVNGDADVSVGVDGDNVEVNVRNKAALGQLLQPYSLAKWDLPGGYYLTMDIDAGKRINGCISAWAAPAFTVRLHRGRVQLWNMHSGIYPRDGRTCFGMYESESHWTRCTCSPTYGETTAAVVASLVGIGIGVATAQLIAQAVTPVLVAAVAL